MVARARWAFQVSQGSVETLFSMRWKNIYIILQPIYLGNCTQKFIRIARVTVTILCSSQAGQLWNRTKPNTVASMAACWWALSLSGRLPLWLINTLFPRLWKHAARSIAFAGYTRFRRLLHLFNRVRGCGEKRNFAFRRHV